MTIYERMQRIHKTYYANAEACKDEGLTSASKIIMASADILADYMIDMPIGVAEMYAGENE